MPLKQHPTKPDMVIYTKTEYGNISVGKEWVGLTDSEREEAVWESGKDGLTSNRYDVALAVEAKLKEKNT